MNQASRFVFYVLMACLVHVSRPVKSPLKAQNGVREEDSPIKKVAKRSRQILDSDEDEAPAVKEQAAAGGQGDKEAKTEEKVKQTFYSHITHEPNLL